MSKNMIKIIALSLCAVIAAGTVSAAVLALGENNTAEQQTSTAVVSQAETENKEAAKDETVYVIGNTTVNGTELEMDSCSFILLKRL